MAPEEPPNYGFSISGMSQHRKRLKMWISGLEWEEGRLSLIIPEKGPIRSGDYIPVWETEAAALKVMKAWEVTEPDTVFHVASVQDNVDSGGPAARNRMLRGVDGFTIPERPGYLLRSNWKPTGLR